jgi:hypothetical protein
MAQPDPLSIYNRKYRGEAEQLGLSSDSILAPFLPQGSPDPYAEEGFRPPQVPQPPPNDGSFSPEQYENFKRRWYTQELWRR